MHSKRPKSNWSKKLKCTNNGPHSAHSLSPLPKRPLEPSLTGNFSKKKACTKALSKWNRKAVGPDGLPVVILMDLAQSVPHLLLKMFNSQQHKIPFWHPLFGISSAMNFYRVKCLRPLPWSSMRMASADHHCKRRRCCPNATEPRCRVTARMGEYGLELADSKTEIVLLTKNCIDTLCHLEVGNGTLQAKEGITYLSEHR